MIFKVGAFQFQQGIVKIFNCYITGSGVYIMFMIGDGDYVFTHKPILIDWPPVKTKSKKGFFHWLIPIQGEYYLSESTYYEIVLR